MAEDRFKPLDNNQVGYVSLQFQYFFNFDSTVCHESSSQDIKANTPCILRLGIDINSKQSFVVALAKIFDMLNKTSTSLSEMKTQIIESIDIDSYMSYQNGNLVNIFAVTSLPVKKSIKILKKRTQTITIKRTGETGVTNISRNPYLTPASDSKSTTGEGVSVKEISGSMLYKKLNDSNPEFVSFVVDSYNNFINYLKSDSEFIDYTYLWDIVCMPNSKLFKEGINLIILEKTDQDSTNTVQVLCPSNHYSKHIHYDHKKKHNIVKK